MAAVTTFRSITEQLSNLSILPREPKNPMAGKAPKRARLPDGRGWGHFYEGLTQPQMDQYFSDLRKFNEIAFDNGAKIETLKEQAFTLLGSHIPQHSFPTSDERLCLAALHGAIEQNRIPVHYQELSDADFDVQLRDLSARIEGIRNRVTLLHAELHNEVAYGPLHNRIQNLRGRWDLQGAYADATQKITELQSNELQTLLPIASDSTEYSRARYKIRERIVKINDIAKTLEKIKGQHPPIDQAQPIEGQIQAVYDKAWGNRIATLLGPVKNHPILTAVALGAIAFAASYIPGTEPLFQAVKNPETYRPVVTIIKTIYGGTWNLFSGIGKMFYE